MYLATRSLYVHGVLAFSEGDPVPAGHLESFGFVLGDDVEEVDDPQAPVEDPTNVLVDDLPPGATIPPALDPDSPDEAADETPASEDLEQLTKAELIARLGADYPHVEIPKRPTKGDLVQLLTVAQAATE